MSDDIRGFYSLWCLFGSRQVS